MIKVTNVFSWANKKHSFSTIFFSFDKMNPLFGGMMVEMGGVLWFVSLEFGNG